MRLLLFLLKHKEVDQKNKVQILSALTQKLELPVNDNFTYDVEGTLLVKGRKLQPEQYMALREGADALKRNETRKLIHEQIAFEAVKEGMYKTISLDTLLFAKCAIWLQQQEDRLIKELSGE